MIATKATACPTCGAEFPGSLELFVRPDGIASLKCACGRVFVTCGLHPSAEQMARLDRCAEKYNAAMAEWKRLPFWKRLLRPFNEAEAFARAQDEAKS